MHVILWSRYSCKEHSNIRLRVSLPANYFPMHVHRFSRTYSQDTLDHCQPLPTKVKCFLVGLSGGVSNFSSKPAQPKLLLLRSNVCFGL